MASTWRRRPEGSDPSREDQVRTILADARRFDGPVVIAGDFNSYGIGPFLERNGYRWLTARHRPDHLDLHLGPHLRPAACAGRSGQAGVVHETRGASDHRPVWAVVVPEATGSPGLAKAAGKR